MVDRPQLSTGAGSFSEWLREIGETAREKYGRILAVVKRDSQELGILPGGKLVPYVAAVIAAGVCPSAVAVDPSGKFAYAADTGDCDFLVGSISIYKINPAFAGTLSATATIDAGACPFSVAVALDPSGKFGGFVYVANSDYFGAFSVLMYSIDSVSGVLTPLTPTGTIAAGTDSRSVAVHPSGKFAYVANFGSNGFLWCWC